MKNPALMSAIRYRSAKPSSGQSDCSFVRPATGGYSHPAHHLHANMINVRCRAVLRTWSRYADDDWSSQSSLNWAPAAQGWDVLLLICVPMCDLTKTNQTK